MATVLSSNFQLNPYDPDEDETVFVDETLDDDSDTAYDPHEDESAFKDGSSDDDSDTEESATTESDNAEDEVEDLSDNPESTSAAPQTVPAEDADVATQKELKPALRFFASLEMKMRYGRG